jgi:CheY-like chemotaxis protein
MVGAFRVGGLPAPGNPSKTLQQTTNPAPSSTAEPPHLLLVQDHADLCAYRTRLLDGDVWRMTAVPDVDHALAVDEPPDLVLSDVMLPGRGGLDLVRLVRSHGQWASVPSGC